MSRRLQNSLMASLTAISFLCTLFSLPAGAQITSTIDESGHRVYINGDGGDAPSRSSRSAGSSASRTPLVYWSVTEHRFKPVPTSGAAMRAARSAASEVTTYLGQKQAGKVQNYQTLNRAFTQQDIEAAIDDAAARHHVDPSLVRSVVKVESNFNPNAVSRKGAMGLMQLMPSTARSLNVANPFDPAQNVEAGVRHLRRLLDSYGGNVRLSLAAYNAGSGAVARSAGVPHFRETQDYVRRITNLYQAGGTGPHVIGGAVHDPVHEQRDDRGVLHMSNTE
jgi:soluble lytic murein transglycosylase-like protein